MQAEHRTDQKVEFQAAERPANKCGRAAEWLSGEKSPHGSLNAHIAVLAATEIPSMLNNFCANTKKRRHPIEKKAL